MRKKSHTNSTKRKGSALELLEPDFALNYIKPQQAATTAPCGANCPSGGNVREWIGIVSQRDKLGLTKIEAYKSAWETITERNPFPATMGRICPHPCESECNRIEKDGAVAVNEMERFLGDWGLESKLHLKRVDYEPRTEKIAVIGAGPAGLSFAYQMARRGYPVTVFDRHQQAGGMLRFGIPDYRLPPAILDAEIARIEDLGVTLQLGTKIGADVSISSLREDFEVVFVGVGAQVGRNLGIPGEQGLGVYTGTDYLHRLNTGESVDPGSDVIVVGGGNTAIDAARAARRQGANVSILYRRTRQEMPAIEQEIDEALEEGIHIEYLSSPIEIKRNSRGIESVVAQRMRLADQDESGRRRPIPIEGDFFEMQASSVMIAVSQEPDWTAMEDLNKGDAWLVTSGNGMLDQHTYAGGDVMGLGIASMAIGHGRTAAESAHARLRGRHFDIGTNNSQGRNPKPAVKLDFYPEKQRVTPHHANIEERLKNPNLEVAESISEDEFLQEASRCLSCENCFGCRHCWMYCNGGGFIEVDDPRPGHYFKIDLSVCEGCGKCIDVCPCGFLKPQSEA